MDVHHHHEKQDPPIDLAIEVRDDTNAETSQSCSRICASAACRLIDMGSDSKDAKERNAAMRKLLYVSGFCILFIAVEMAGGIMANSLAILTDAAHLLSDVASFAVSLFSLWAASWKATPRQSYGFFRIEILGALVSIQLIWLLTGILVYEAIHRLANGSGEIMGGLMFIVSAIGLVVNIVMAIILGHDHAHGHGHGHGHGHAHGHCHGHGHDHGHHHHGGHGDYDVHGGKEHKNGHECSVATHNHNEKLTHEDVGEPLLKHEHDAGQSHPQKKKRQMNINVHGAYLHVLGDMIQSIGVMIGGAIIWYKPEWKVIDLFCTLTFSIIVMGTTFRMLRSILEVLMESTPRDIDATMLERGLCEMEGVVAVHELHIWALTVGKVILACHVTISPDADSDLALGRVIDFIRREYNISHVTIQIERQ